MEQEFERSVPCAIGALWSVSAVVLGAWRMADAEGTEAGQGKRLVMDSHLQLQQRAIDRRDETGRDTANHVSTRRRLTKNKTRSRWDVACCGRKCGDWLM